MRVGDLVKPLVIFEKKTVGIIVSGPKRSNGLFGIHDGLLYEVLINGHISHMFEDELKLL